MLAIPSLVSAMPIAQGRPGFPGFPGFPGPPGGGKPGFALQVPSCPLTRAKLELPAGAAAGNVTLPASEKPVFVALGVGVQVCLAPATSSSSLFADLAVFLELHMCWWSLRNQHGRRYSLRCLLLYVFDDICPLTIAEFQEQP